MWQTSPDGYSHSYLLLPPAICSLLCQELLPAQGELQRRQSIPTSQLPKFQIQQGLNQQLKQSVPELQELTCHSTYSLQWMKRWELTIQFGQFAAGQFAAPSIWHRVNSASWWVESCFGSRHLKQRVEVDKGEHWPPGSLQHQSPGLVNQSPQSSLLESQLILRKHNSDTSASQAPYALLSHLGCRYSLATANPKGRNVCLKLLP